MLSSIYNLQSQAPLTLLALLLLLFFQPPPQAQPSPRVVEITAERFDFSPSRITVAPGETIELHLTSDDTAHGFKIAGTDIDIEIPKRGHGKAVLKFTAGGEGPWKFECSRMCGAGHHFMRGEIVIRKEPR